MAKKGPSKAEQEFKRALKNFRERLRYWAKKGYVYEGKTPKTTQGLKNVKADKIKKEKYYHPELVEEKPKYPSEPDEEDYDNNYPYDDSAEAYAMVQELVDYIESFYPTDVNRSGKSIVEEKVDHIKGRLRNILDSAVNHYGEYELGKWLVDSGTGDELYAAVAQAIENYTSPEEHIAEFASLLNGGPLTQEQSENLSMYGVFDFYRDELY